MADRPLRNIGVFAHVDAGKTTLTEQLLRHAGVIRQAGSVDSGTTRTDNLPVERRRGISVKASCVRLTWRGVDVNLIDTPGHVDFSAEVERSLWALDGAVLVVCAREGVQPQTETLFAALAREHIPTVIFINKTDREGADPARVMKQIYRRLTARVVDASNMDAVLDAVCALDDVLLERYLAGEDINPVVVRRKFAALARQGEICPALMGSALRDTGVEAVLDAIVDDLPAPDGGSDGLCGVAFAAGQDRLLGRGVWLRLYSGQLANREAVTLPAGVDPVTGEKRFVQRKVTQIRTVDGQDAGVLSAGEIGVVYGLGDLPIGHVLGEEALLPRRVMPGTLRTPLITVQVIPENAEDMQALRAACETLAGEDPLLQAHYARRLNELQLHVMGMIQLEILQELLDTRFGLKVHFSEPTVLYRETIAREAKGFVAYLAPKPCWAVMEFLIEPGKRGSGVVFSSIAPVKDIAPGYQHQVEQALPLALHQGRLGWPVTDVRITLLGGNHHIFHTHPLDFIVATPMGIHDGLQRGGSILLEPVLEVTFMLPAECVGRVMSDVAQMRGSVTDTVTDEDRVILRAEVPVQSSMMYAATLAAVTGGRGGMSARLMGYRECPLELGCTAPRRGVNPLDTSRYILAARNALEGGIFDEW